MAVGPATPKGPVQAGGPDIEATLGHVGSARPSTHAEVDEADRTASISGGGGDV